MLVAVAAGVAVGASAVVAVVIGRRNRNTRDDFVKQFRTQEEFRKAVAADGDRIRSIRETQSEMAAIKAVRDEFPGAPLRQVIQVVRAL
ncbi:hypothetical protein ACIP5L_30675 [Streptomyces bacillaris]|uniref:hypothetical protein n=1 Tax=Streptomyces bacillaris TaxID=68179 RepID=UPI003810D032